MRRLLAIFTVLTLSLALTAPASAKKGGAQDPPDPPDGLSCAQMQYPITAEYPGSSSILGYQEFPGGFSFALSDDLHAACIDVTAPQGTWEVTIDLGTARQTGFSIKDSVPGDWCVPWTTTKTDTVFSTDELRDGEVPAEVPASAIDACGTDFTDPSPPLAFQAEFRGRGTVTYTVTVPSAP
jgi:hypothetical protein